MYLYGNVSGKNKGGDDECRAPKYDFIAGREVHELGKPAELVLLELTDSVTEVILLSLEFNNHHVVDHLVGGFHARSACP